MVTEPVQDPDSAAFAPLVRPLDPGDLDALTPLDAAYAAALGAGPYVNRGSLHFFGRTGHSFVAEAADGSPLGFVLAHSTWTGGHPALRLERLVAVVGDDREDVAAALAEAVVKSAYDAGVYRLSAETPAADDVGRTALARAGFERREVVAFGRTLGSAGRNGTRA